MSRFLTPLLFVVAGLYVGWYNQNHVDSAMLFPFLPSLMPALDGELAAQGRASAGLLMGIGGLFLLSALFRRRPPPSES